MLVTVAGFLIIETDVSSKTDRLCLLQNETRDFNSPFKKTIKIEGINLRKGSEPC